MKVNLPEVRVQVSRSEYRFARVSSTNLDDATTPKRCIVENAR